MEQPLELILDGGHGWETPGKRSPFKDVDGKTVLRENEFADSMVNKISMACHFHHIKCHIVSPESADTPLGVRTSRANQIITASPHTNFLLLSCHADAYPPDPRVSGSRIYYQNILSGLPGTEKTRRTKSHQLAVELSKVMGDCVGVASTKALPGNFHMTREVICQSLLLEFGFMTNKKDIQILCCDKSRNTWAENIVLWVKHIDSHL